MKRIITTLVLCCLFMLQANVVLAQQQEVTQTLDTAKTQVTQTPGWQWSDHPGTLSITFGAPSLVGIIYTQGIGCYGAYSLRYEHNLKKWLAVDMVAQYEGWKVERTKQNVNQITTVHRVDLTLGVNFTYVNHEHVQVYSGVGLGISDYIENQTSRISVAGYLTAVGVRLGSKRVFAMAEVNAGTTSMFTFGLCFKI